MGEFGPWHLLIVAGVFVVLFGAKKLPDAARSLGKSARILKTELKDLHGDNENDPAATQVAALQAATPPSPVVPAAPVAAPVPVTTPAPVAAPIPVSVPESAAPAAQPPAQ